MEPPGNRRYDDQVIDISRSDSGLASLHNEEHTSRMEPPEPEWWQEGQPSSGSEAAASRNHAPSLSRGHSTNSSSMRRIEGYNHGTRSPLNSGLWISVQSAFTLGQIIAAIVVMSLSGDEDPEAPLFLWVAVYTAGCVVTLPFLYWRYYNFNRSTEHEANQSDQGAFQSGTASEPPAYRAISVAPAPTDENEQRVISSSTQTTGSMASRTNRTVYFSKVALDCFFAVWFVVGNVWILGYRSSPADAPLLYRLCLVFLIFSFIGYAMPFILCTTICCCLPCIISVLGAQGDLSQTRGATPEAINALPKFKFKLKVIDNSLDINSVPNEGGFLTAGTEKEQDVSGEAAVCCICLTNYEDEDELRKLPCLHFFHVECIDKWLKINATCPLCKFEIVTKDETSSSASNSHNHPS